MSGAAGMRGEHALAARRFRDPLGDFDVAPRVRHTSHRHRPRRRRWHECLWCGGWFRPRERSSRLCSLACRRECHEGAITAGVAAGQSDREIARRVGLSPATLTQKRLALRVMRGPEPPQLRRYRLGGRAVDADA